MESKQIVDKLLVNKNKLLSTQYGSEQYSKIGNQYLSEDE